MIGVIDDVEAVAAADHSPVVVRDSAATRAAGSGPSPVVLQAALDPIERQPIVGVDLVKLADRDVRDELPVLGAIVGDRDAAVLADPDAVGIFRVDPNSVVIAVDTRCDAAPGAAAVDRRRYPHADRV